MLVGSLAQGWLRMRLDSNCDSIAVVVDRADWSLVPGRCLAHLALILGHIVTVLVFASGTGLVGHQSTLVERDPLCTERSLQILSLPALMRLIRSHNGTTLPRFASMLANGMIAALMQRRTGAVRILSWLLLRLVMGSLSDEDSFPGRIGGMISLLLSKVGGDFI